MATRVIKIDKEKVAMGNLRLFICSHALSFFSVSRLASESYMRNGPQAGRRLHGRKP